jgi:hypothetical protein
VCYLTHRNESTWSHVPALYKIDIVHPMGECRDERLQERQEEETPSASMLSLTLAALAPSLLPLLVHTHASSVIAGHPTKKDDAPMAELTLPCLDARLVDPTSLVWYAQQQCVLIGENAGIRSLHGEVVGQSGSSEVRQYAGGWASQFTADRVEFNSIEEKTVRAAADVDGLSNDEIKALYGDMKCHPCTSDDMHSDTPTDVHLNESRFGQVHRMWLGPDSLFVHDSNVYNRKECHSIRRIGGPPSALKAQDVAYLTVPTTAASKLYGIKVHPCSLTKPFVIMKKYTGATKKKVINSMVHLHAHTHARMFEILKKGGEKVRPLSGPSFHSVALLGDGTSLLSDGRNTLSHATLAPSLGQYSMAEGSACMRSQSCRSGVSH